MKIENLKAYIKSFIVSLSQFLHPETLGKFHLFYVFFESTFKKWTESYFLHELCSLFTYLKTKFYFFKMSLIFNACLKTIKVSDTNDLAVNRFH